MNEQTITEPSLPNAVASTWRDAWRTITPYFAVPLLLALAGAINSAWIPTLTVDANSAAGKHPLVGAVSGLGLLFWCASATLCLLAWRHLAQTAPVAVRTPARFFAASAALSGYLLADDWLQIHEQLAPRHLHLHELVVIALLGLAVLAYLWTFRRLLLSHPDRHCMAIALAFLCASVVIDTVTQVVFGDLGDWEYLFEDGFKWMGIAAWFSFFWRAARRAIGTP